MPFFPFVRNFKEKMLFIKLTFYLLLDGMVLVTLVKSYNSIQGLGGCMILVRDQRNRLPPFV